MLHAIDADGMITWHCHTSTCVYHNCAMWHPAIRCADHRAGVAGQSLTAHVRDCRWSEDGRGILLPPCPIHGSQTQCLIHTEHERTPPVIMRDETGRILQVTMLQGHEAHGNLWIKDVDITHTPVPHPTLAHLSPDEIRAMQEHLRSKAPDAPVDWMLSTVARAEIRAVFAHPAVALHQELARQLLGDI